MSWPTPQDYNEAIQDPRLCFCDEVLQGGSVELNPLGMPKPYSGGFATVYKVACADRVWAVRCFQREQPDQQQRYAIIGEHLHASGLDAVVGFDLLAEGIRVGGKWYPIVKMEWVEGPLLHDYIAQNLAKPEVLLALARKWVQLLRSLQQAGIAHGDLQHGNIIVADGHLKLIDYDGMFVPGLADFHGLEDGHRNYQHPGRNGADFGLQMDHFSAWLVLTSIAAVGIEPKLWYALDAGDECLLFRRGDYERPEASKALRLLEAAEKQPELPVLAANVRALLALRPAELPDLDSPICQGEPAEAVAVTAESTTIAEPPLEPAAASFPIAAPNTATAEEITQWLVRQDPPAATFASIPMQLARAGASASLAISGAGIIWGLTGDFLQCSAGLALAATAGTACVWLLKKHYSRLSIVIDRANAQLRVRALEGGMQKIQTDIRAHEAERTRVCSVSEQLETQLEHLPEKLEATLADLKARLKHGLTRIARKREAIQQAMEQELKAGASPRAARVKHGEPLRALEQAEQDMNRQYDIEVQLAERDAANAERDLIAKCRKVRQQIENRCHELDAQLDRLRRTLRGQELDIARANRQVDRYRAISFNAYLLYLAHPRP
jgi:hypothetical protein